jgi:hypothetical protein
MSSKVDNLSFKMADSMASKMELSQLDTKIRSWSAN